MIFLKTRGFFFSKCFFFALKFILPNEERKTLFFKIFYFYLFFYCAGEGQRIKIVKPSLTPFLICLNSKTCLRRGSTFSGAATPCRANEFLLSSSSNSSIGCDISIDNGTLLKRTEQETRMLTGSEGEDAGFVFGTTSLYAYRFTRVPSRKVFGTSCFWVSTRLWLSPLSGARR